MKSFIDKLKRKISKSVMYRYYSVYKPKYALNKENNRKNKIIISLTSYPDRFGELPICIKSLMNQTMKPDKIILCLGVDTQAQDITKELLDLQKYGLTIIRDLDNIKPHKKYFYAMTEYPDDIIITVDDDVIYDRYLVEALVNSYKKYPNSVSARRVHEITFDENGKILPYNDWIKMCEQFTKPSKLLLATGVGGILYPPNCMVNDVFNLENIKQYCLNADDIWLKCMQILKGTPVVWVKTRNKNPILLDISNQTPLGMTNILKNQNDQYFENLIDIYNISMHNFFDE